MKRAIKIDEAAAIVRDGATVMIGGFMGVGSPHRMFDALIRRHVRDLTVIANDSGMLGVGIGKLVTADSAGDGLKRPSHGRCANFGPWRVYTQEATRRYV